MFFQSNANVGYAFPVPHTGTVRVAAKIGAAIGIASDGGAAYDEEDEEDEEEDDEDEDEDAAFCGPGTEARFVALMLIWPAAYAAAASL